MAGADCRSRLEAGLPFKRGSDPDLVIKSICEKGPSDSGEKCIKGYLRQSSMFRGSPDRAQFLCGAANGAHQNCFDQLKGKKLSYDDVTLFWTCFEPDQSQRDCNADGLSRRVFERSSDIATYCKVPSVGGRECVLANFSSHRAASVEDAMEICKYRGKDTRDCLIEHKRGLAPFDTVKVSDTDAVEVCKVTNLKDRKCVLDSIHEHFMSSLRDQIALCSLASEEESVCLKILDRHQIPGSFSAHESICHIPNFEIRACVIEHFLEGVRSPGILEMLAGDVNPMAYVQTCAAEFANALAEPLDAITHGIGCEFTR